MRQLTANSSYDRKYYKKEWVGKNLTGRMLAQFIERKDWYEVKSSVYIDDFAKKCYRRSSYTIETARKLEQLIDGVCLALTGGDYIIPADEVDQIKAFVYQFKCQDIASSDTDYKVKAPFLFSIRVTQSNFLWKFDKQAAKYLMSFIVKHSSELHKTQKRLEDGE